MDINEKQKYPILSIGFGKPDFNENEDQIEIILDETNFDQGLKNIRVEPNEIGQSVVYLNNEAIVAINSETPLSLADIGFSKANT